MRLTKKDERFGFYYNGREDEIEFDALNKLGQLEDIEEEVGIDLRKLMNAFNKIYYKKGNEIKLSIHIALVDWAIYVLEENATIGEGIRFELSDYGKTWALTKEELL